MNSIYWGGKKQSRCRSWKLSIRQSLTILIHTCLDVLIENLSKNFDKKCLMFYLKWKEKEKNCVVINPELKLVIKKCIWNESYERCESSLGCFCTTNGHNSSKKKSQEKILFMKNVNGEANVAQNMTGRKWQSEPTIERESSRNMQHCFLNAIPK